jgi:trans-aconitate methyltransferase
MDPAEFDKFAEEYLATHAENLKISGEDPDYFARAKAEVLRRRWTRLGLAEPTAILDFGAGIGNAWPHLTAAFPRATLTGLDVSEKSLAIAERRFPGLATAVRYDGDRLPFQPASFDLIFSACVFHHIPAERHVDLFAQLRGLLRPQGRVAIFEHNPLNPVTRHIVDSCEFDENAVLISASDMKRLQAKAGLQGIEAAYTGFFPGALSALRPLERWMTALPIGAQYYTLAHA